MKNCCKKPDKEYMKIAMMKHEEIFRNQVHELHRLYKIQKRLMEDIKAEETNLDLTLAVGIRRKEDVGATAMDFRASFSPTSAQFAVKKWKECQMSGLSERKSSFEVEDEVRKRMIKQSPVLLQCLSLKMT